MQLFFEMRRKKEKDSVKAADARVWMTKQESERKKDIIWSYIERETERETRIEANNKQNKRGMERVTHCLTNILNKGGIVNE